MRSEVPSKGWEWTNLVLGLALACTAIMFAGLPIAAWNAGIVGALIVCCSAVALHRYGAWTEWSNLVWGCWAMIAPFLLGFGAAQAPMQLHIVIGLCVATIAVMQLLADRRARALSSTNSTPR